MRTKFLKADAYKEFLSTGKLSEVVLTDFDQSGFWTLWASNSQAELQEALGEEKWNILEDKLKSLKLTPQDLEYTNQRGERVLKTSFHEHTLPRFLEGKNSKRHFPETEIPYHIIKGCIKTSLSLGIKAPNLKEVGSIVLLIPNGGMNCNYSQRQKKGGDIQDPSKHPADSKTPKIPKKEFFAPNLSKIHGDLRIWKGGKINCPKLEHIGGNFILENEEQNMLPCPSLPGLKRVGGSIYCRSSTTLSLANLTHVGGAISGYMTTDISLPKLKEIKSLRLDLTKISSKTILKLIANLSDKSLKELHNDCKKHPQTIKTSISNPTGPELYNLIKDERLKRILLKPTKTTNGKSKGNKLKTLDLL